MAVIEQNTPSALNTPDVSDDFMYRSKLTDLSSISHLIDFTKQHNDTDKVLQNIKIGNNIY